MLWIDVKYANMISNRLGRYSLKNNKPFLANFRCHYCGDSAKNKGKSRGYLIEKGGADFLIYFCHTCGNRSHPYLVCPMPAWTQSTALV